MLLWLWSAFCVCAVLSLASTPWVLVRQRRRVDDLASFSSLVAAGPGMLLFVAAELLPERAWQAAAWVWPLYLLGVLWAGLWMFGGPWLLAECLRHRTREQVSPLLDGARLAHAACWLTSTLLPLSAILGWMIAG